MNRRTLLAAALIALSAAAFIAIWLMTRTAAPDPATYEAATRAFYSGLASLEVGLLDDARTRFGRTTELVPQEPAGWANLGLAHIRLGEFDAASGPLDRASALAPESGDLALMFGQMEAARGRVDESLAHLQRAVDLDPRNLMARFSLAEQIEASGAGNADLRADQQLEAILAAAPDNLVALLERTRLAVKRRDAAALRTLVARLDAQRARRSWTPRAEEQYVALERATAAQDFGEAARAIVFLRNVLAPTAAFQESLDAVRPESGLIAEPFVRFVRLPASSPAPSPPDTALEFTSQPVDGAAVGSWTTLVAFSPDGTGNPALVAAGDAGIRRLDGVNGSEPAPIFSGGATASLLAIDWNYDFRMDLVRAAGDGIRLFLQSADGGFTDATADASKGAEGFSTDSVGAWPADIEMDGDLDVVVGTRDGAPVVLRNNGDGTWRPVRPFPDVSGLRAFAWGDLDADADPDAALLDAQGDLFVYENRQAGEFRRLSDGARTVVAFTIGDVNADGALDLVTLDRTGAVRRLSRGPDGTSYQTDLVVWRALDGAPGSYRLFLADVDNNGAIDVVASGASGSAVWLGGRESLVTLAAAPEMEVFNVVDLDGDGSLDLAGLRQGQAVRMLGRGRMGYHWETIRPRAQSAAGDQRINSFGVGGEIEIRSGLLVQKQVIAGPSVHFGLGARTGIDVARILWPNGVVQAEFDRPADQVIVADQRLKGSCPWVFTHDGSGMRFVTDFLWRSPLGLRINAQDTAGVTQTEDRIKIRGDQLAPRDGVYDVRITAELWETHFIDHASLLVVDHPADVEVHVDERFAQEPPALAARATSPARPIARAWDDGGRDVTELIAHQDGRYLATFERGAYQGIAADHFVEIELREVIPVDTPLWLVAHGWIYPTDSSINVAIGQGRHVQPRGLALEAQDETGRWTVVSGDLGFPAGKNKTILIDLRTIAAAGVRQARRLRLRTNLEIYWDRIALAEGGDDRALRTIRLNPSRAELRYRGFSATRYDRREVPETPDYNRIVSVGQRWRDLTGYHTRFGDVRPLVDGIDDRYVIMNAGDELRLEFPASTPLPSGWQRDFILIGDGWEKDGDYNTGFSSTVHPLPTHASPDYRRSPEGPELENDPVYRQHAADWETYHTRFVTPRAFVRGLWR